MWEGNAISSSFVFDREEELAFAVVILIEVTYGKFIGDPYKTLLPGFQALCGPSHSGRGHVTSFGQWNVSKCDVSRGHKFLLEPSCHAVRKSKPCCEVEKESHTEALEGETLREEELTWMIANQDTPGEFPGKFSHVSDPSQLQPIE